MSNIPCSRWTLAPAALVMAMALAPLASGSNLSFLDNAVVSKFKKQDMDLLLQTVDKVLASTDPRASDSWSNTKTGNSGTVAVTGQFTSTDGQSCKSLTVSSRTPQMQGKSDYVMCNVPGRGWLLHPDAKPTADAAVAPGQK
jgi:surface antigen